jgi:ABC-type transport system involved in cytochrome bd biosynthesis fused ATPase/permease subunit
LRFEKSTLLLGMLGELENYTGSISVGGKIFYISQQAWIFPASLKQNILFGMPYNKIKFEKVVEVCSLKKVFSIDNKIFVCILFFYFKFLRIWSCSFLEKKL